MQNSSKTYYDFGGNMCLGRSAYGSVGHGGPYRGSSYNGPTTLSFMLAQRPYSEGRSRSYYLTHTPHQSGSLQPVYMRTPYTTAAQTQTDPDGGLGLAREESAQARPMHNIIQLNSPHTMVSAPQTLPHTNIRELAAHLYQRIADMQDSLSGNQNPMMQRTNYILPREFQRELNDAAILALGAHLQTPATVLAQLSQPSQLAKAQHSELEARIQSLERELLLS